MKDEFDFSDLEEIRIPVTICKTKYLLVEASADVARQYRNLIIRSTKLGPDGKPSSMEGMADAEPLLVSLCLFEVVGDDKKLTAVSLSDVKSMPARVVKRLFKKVQDISELSETETEESLTKTLADTSEKLRKLHENGDGKERVKNVPSAATD